jgi:hypothetical protein
MPNLVNLTGRKFSRLTVLSLNVERSTKKRKFWNCVCECGNIKSIESENLKTGKTRSCGCLQKEMKSKPRPHLKIYSYEEYPLRHIWKLMMRRCYNSTDPTHRYYGARGIKVCERWHDYWQFKEDMWPRPEGLTLERIDNDGDYAPINCKWATVCEQTNNRRTSKKITMNGESKTIPDWCRVYNVTNVSAVRQRLDRGWDLYEALIKPIKKFRDQSKSCQAE